MCDVLHVSNEETRRGTRCYRAEPGTHWTSVDVGLCRPLGLVVDEDAPVAVLDSDHITSRSVASA
ncbi:hypothetical protein BLAT2472_20337 [Burkholderia latens]